MPWRTQYKYLSKIIFAVALAYTHQLVRFQKSGPANQYIYFESHTYPLSRPRTPAL